MAGLTGWLCAGVTGPSVRCLFPAGVSVSCRHCALVAPGWATPAVSPCVQCQQRGPFRGQPHGSSVVLPGPGWRTHHGQLCSDRSSSELPPAPAVLHVCHHCHVWAAVVAGSGRRCGGGSGSGGTTGGGERGGGRLSVWSGGRDGDNWGATLRGQCASGTHTVYVYGEGDLEDCLHVRLSICHSAHHSVHAALK